jgi:hypothetical protein
VFLFLVWAVPALSGILLLATPSLREIAPVIMSSCPWIGIGLSSAPSTQGVNPEWFRLATIASPIAITFVFSFLIEARLRLLDRNARTTPVKAPEPDFIQI